MDSMISHLFHTCCISNRKVNFWSVHGFDDFTYLSYLLYFNWKSTLFGASMDSSFLTIFHFCYTSLLIFKILMLIFEQLNILNASRSRRGNQCPGSARSSTARAWHSSSDGFVSMHGQLRRPEESMFRLSRFCVSAKSISCSATLIS